MKRLVDAFLNSVRAFRRLAGSEAAFRQELLLLVLAARVSAGRRRFRVGLGDGGNAELQRAIRVHANAVEWALPVLVLYLVVQRLAGGSFALAGSVKG